MLEKDVLPTPPASPVAKRPLAAGGRREQLNTELHTTGQYQMVFSARVT